MKTQTIKKADLIKLWQALPEDADMVKAIVPMEYKHEGSSYGCDGVRIDGSLEFIKAVLGHLKPLINMENHVTRLSVSCSEIAERTKKAGGGVEFGGGTGKWCCYIRAALRGEEGAMASAFFDKHLDGATKVLEQAYSSN